MSDTLRSNLTIPPTLAEHLSAWVQQLEVLVRHLVTEHGAPYDYTNNDRGGLVFITPHPYAWPELTIEGRQLQSRLLQEYRDFTNIVRVLLMGQSEQALRAFKEDSELLATLIERKEHGYRTVDRALEKGLAALRQHLAVLADAARVRR